VLEDLWDLQLPIQCTVERLLCRLGPQDVHRGRCVSNATRMSMDYVRWPGANSFFGRSRLSIVGVGLNQVSVWQGGQFLIFLIGCMQDQSWFDGNELLCGQTLCLIRRSRRCAADDLNATTYLSVTAVGSQYVPARCSEHLSQVGIELSMNRRG
jgi:hypothetical protein